MPVLLDVIALLLATIVPPAPPADAVVDVEPPVPSTSEPHAHAETATAPAINPRIVQSLIKLS
jgi:hypothetical protein